MRRKILPLAATTVALVLGMGVGSAWAYFTDSTWASGAMWIKAETTTIFERNSLGMKEISIHNNKEKENEGAPVWVRVRIFAPAELKANATGTNWAGSIDDWYYYQEVLQPDADTSVLTVNFNFKNDSKRQKSEKNSKGAVAGDETNVVVVYECVPVSYDALGQVAPAVWAE